MDFSLDEMQSMLSDSVGKYISNDYDFDTRQRGSESDSSYSEETWQTFAELGWTAVPFSEDDGGLDGGAVEIMLMMQHFGRGLVVEPYLANVILAGGVLKRAASAAQKEAWLQPMIAGELQTALAFTEPQTRYELADIALRAEPDGNNWVLNGSKSVVFNAGNANMLIVAARTAGNPGDSSGISLFAVDAKTDGMTIRSYKTVDGMQAGDLDLRNVAVNDSALLGKANEGFSTLRNVIDDATLAVCAEAVGIMQALKDKTVEYAGSRTQFGKPIGSFQALQHRMVDMLTLCEQSYSLLLWATMAIADQTDDAQRAVHAIKYQIGTAGRKVGEESVQLHGGMGVTWELDVAHYFKRLTVINQIFGNSDWHLDKLAQTD